MTTARRRGLPARCLGTPSTRRNRRDTLSNGALLNAADAAGFELLLTTDRRIRHQQNLQARVALVVLTGTTRWSLVRQHGERIAAAVASATHGSYAEIEIPFEPK